MPVIPGASRKLAAKFYDKGGAVFNVMHPDYGVTGVAGVDETAALLLAWADLVAAGGGTLLIPCNLRIGSTDFSVGLPASPLMNATGLKGIRVISLGTITVDRAFTAGQTLNVFQFDGCEHVDTEIAYCTSQALTRDGRGATLVKVIGASRRIGVRGSFENMRGPLEITAAAGAADTARTKGVSFDVTLKNCCYGPAFQFSGDDAEGKIVADGSLRSYFIYGIRNHRVRVESKNNQSDDCIIRGYNGQGCENVDITYINKGSTTGQNAAHCVSLAPNVSSIDLTPCVMRNIKLDIHVEWPGAGNGGPGHAFFIEKTLNDTTADVTDRGHIIEGLDIAIHTKGQNGDNSALPIAWGGTWGTGEEFRNPKVRRLQVEGGASSVALHGFGGSLKDMLTIERIVSNVEVYIAPGANGRALVMNAKAPCLVDAVGNTDAITYVNCNITAGTRVAYQNKRYFDSVINGTKVGIHPLIPLSFALTDAATIAVDASVGSIFTVTLAGNRTVGAPTNPLLNQVITFYVTQDGTGARTLAWNAVFKHAWVNTGNTAGKISTISFRYDGTNWVQQGAQGPYV